MKRYSSKLYIYLHPKPSPLCLISSCRIVPVNVDFDNRTMFIITRIETNAKLGDILQSFVYKQNFKMFVNYTKRYLFIYCHKVRVMPTFELYSGYNYINFIQQATHTVTPLFRYHISNSFLPNVQIHRFTVKC